MNKICGIDVSRCNHEHMNPLVVEVWRNDPTAAHGYKLSRSYYGSEHKSRSNRITSLFLAWFIKCGNELRKGE